MDLTSRLRYEAAEQHNAVHPEVVAAFSLDGRTAVVTGAASGIGRRTAQVYAQAGATAVVLADRDTEGLEAAVSEVEGFGVKALAVPTDVSDATAVNGLARAALRASGRVDVWANVAGIVVDAPVLETTEAQVDAMVGVNLKGMFFGTAAAGKAMSAARRGSIVNVSSASGEVPVANLTAYGMAKAGVLQLTRNAALELGPAGVRVNAVAPGFVETPISQRVWTRPDGSVDEERRAEIVEARRAAVPLRTVGTPDDIAWVLLFLAADASRFVTGQILRVNGGMYMA